MPFAPACGFASLADRHLNPHPVRATVSADNVSAPAGSMSPTAAAPVAPVSGHTALAVLGSMVILIVALMVLLVQTTWVDPASATEAPPVAADGGGLALR